MLGGTSPLTFLSRGMTAVYLVDRLVSGIGHLIEKADKFNDSLVVLEQRGAKPAAIAGVEELVEKIALTVPGVRLEGAGKDAGSLRAVIGESPGHNPADTLADVKALLPHLEEVFAAMAGGGRVLSEDDHHKIMRAVELGGGATDPITRKISPEKFAESLDAIYKVMMTAGSVVTAGDLLNLSQQGAVVAKAMGDYPAFLKTMIAPLIDMKGSRAGTALQAAGRAYFGGIMTKKVALENERMGIIPEGSVVTEPGGHGAWHLKPESMKILTDGLAGGLDKFIENVMRPNLEKRGLTTVAQQNAEIFRIDGTDTFRRLTSLFLTNADQVLKEQKMMEGVPAVADALKLLNEKSIGFNITAMSAAVGNFLDVLEKANAGTIIGVTHAVAGLFNLLAGGQEALTKDERDKESRHKAFGSMWNYAPWEKGWWLGGQGGARPENAPVPVPEAKPEKHSALDSPERFGNEVGKAVKLALNGVSVNMDGRKVGQLVSDHQADSMSRPPTGGNSPDPRVSPIYAGVGGNWSLA